MPTFTAETIDRAISDYVRDARTTTLPVFPTSDCLRLFQILKREPLVDGPWSRLSLFEAANRALSDLVVLGAARYLLREAVQGQTAPMKKIAVTLGNENGFDLSGVLPTGANLRGECFNVAPTFYAFKQNQSRKKLKATNAAVLVIAFNQDAVARVARPRDARWLYLPVDMRACF